MTVFGRLKRRFIGDRGFYRTLFLLVLPIVIQQGITTFVSLLDNIMVGALCTESISGVAIANQLTFVFQLTIFGAISGASIYSAQFYGHGDMEGVRHSFRFKLMIGVIITAIAIAVFSIFGEELIALYIHADIESTTSPELTASEAESYLWIALAGLFPFMVTQCYASTLKEAGATTEPMKASIAGVIVNAIFNYLLIYGKLGFPNMGVRGAAVATVMSRFVEVGVILIFVYGKNKAKYPYLSGALRSFRVPMELVKKISKTGAPLLLNEFLWSTGTALITQCYSVRGLQVVAATNITATVWQLFAIIMFAMGSAVSIMCGQRLGANDIDGARDVCRKLIFFDVAAHIVMGALIIACSNLIPEIYNVDDVVREMTAKMIRIDGLALWLHAFTHAAYFAIRSGGRTIVTFLFDSVYTWVISLPLAAILCYRTDLDMITVFFCMQFIDVVKLSIAVPLLTSGSWARNVIGQS